ncbi:MAG: hypothetical protein HOI47_14795 [Candidatus Scalindua sp.]|jgi:tetratricopeptide (TPR) repeat protein|nr:hypothetical protein [Candidatus Scalindua sp.]MBT6227911.1 hypothetical protein [Candidatus Scalindua sp.]
MSKDDDTKNIDERIGVLEDQHINLQVLTEQVNTCKSNSEINSRWYKHQGIVTISVLALLITAVSVIGYYGGKDLIKSKVGTSVEDSVRNSISEFETNVNRRLIDLDKKIDAFMADTEKKADEMLVDIGNSMPPDVLVTEDGDNILTESGDKIVIEDKFGFENWYDMGAGAYNNKRYLKSIQYFSNALEGNPNKEAEAYTRYYMGLAYTQSNEYSLAIENYDKAIALIPGYAVAIENKAIAYFYLKDYRNSINGFAESSKAYKSGGNDKKALNNIRNAIAMLSELDNTQEEIKQLQEYQEREQEYSVRE